MMAVMAAKWIGDAFGKEGIYSLWIAMRKYPWLPPLDYRDNGEVAGQFMVPFANLVVVEDGITLEDLGMGYAPSECYNVLIRIPRTTGDDLALCRIPSC